MQHRHENEDDENTLHLALYGNVDMPRGRCEACKSMALIIDGRLACCGAQSLVQPERTKRISHPFHERRLPPLAERIACLAAQDDRCMYCFRPFGSIVWRRTKPTTLRINWDHVTPFCYSQDNNMCNFVAACHICNGMKSSKIYQTFEEARIDMIEKWNCAGYSDSSPYERRADR